MKSLKGLVVNGKFLAAKPTGVHRVAMYLLRELQKQRATLDEMFSDGMYVLAPRNGKVVSDIKPNELYSHSRLIGQAWEQIELPVHAHGNLLLSLCNLAPVISRNAITMIHDAQVYTSPGSYSFAFRQWYRLVLPRLGRNSLQILTVSEFSARQLVEYGVAPADRITVIYNGVDHVLGFARDATANQRHNLLRHGYVLALANTQEHKNIGILLQAFALPEMRDLRLVLMGAATAEDFIAKGHAIPPNVVFVGKVSDEQMRVLMEEALCFAMPSLTEGFGLPPLEAMMLGCPAVLAPCGSLPEVGGDSVLYADPREPGAWRDAVLRLRDEPGLRDQMVDMGRTQSGRFTWAAAGQRLVDTLRRFASHPPR